MRSRYSGSAYDEWRGQTDAAFQHRGRPAGQSQRSVRGGARTSFYVTNDHVTRTALGRFAEDYLLWPHADLLYFNGTSFRISVQRIAFPNGVCVTPDGGHLYVAVTNERRLIAFSREPFFGNLTEIGSLSLPGAAGQYFDRCRRAI